MSEKPNPPARIRVLHSHAWMMSAAGFLAGAGLLIFAPTLKAVSNSLFLFAGFHVIGAMVLLGSAYSLGLRRLFVARRSGGAASPLMRGFDFGWGPEWMNGLGLIALVALWIAIAIEVAAPNWWPGAFLALVLGAGFFAGNLIMRSFRSADHVVLPMVDLVRGDDDLILDAGCGAGRTTIALSKVLRNGRVVAADRFDADYIADGGRQLIARNMQAANLGARVTIETADLTSLPFSANQFDGAVSTNVFDHLGKNKQRALSEIFRVLKPGGRFLLAVWVPSWPMFAVANIFSLLLTPRAAWRGMAGGAGFAVVDEGVFNFAWFVLLEKPLGISVLEARPS